MEFIATITDFYQTHQIISIIALVVVLFFLYQSPKETFKFLVFAAILASVVYFFMQLGSSSDPGVSTKKELTQKTKKALGD
jgi:RsiW-degrading membrane proteinase PrsW (M82 family)